MAAIPAQITELKDNNMVEVNILGATREASIDLTPTAEVGDWRPRARRFRNRNRRPRIRRGNPRTGVKRFPEMVAEEVPEAASKQAIVGPPKAKTASALQNVLNQDLKQFKNPSSRGLIESIYALAPDHANLMEVCGTHGRSRSRNGIRGIMPEGTRLLSGPGCPVCVTANKDIDTVIALARIPEVTITTFGDMTRVPGSTSSLLAERLPAGRSKSSIRRSTR